MAIRTLVVPPAAQRDDNAIQMLSAWIAEKGLHCTLNIGMWHDDGRPEAPAWGILLADVIRHIANAMREEYGAETDKTIQTVLEALNQELEAPTSKMKGGFHPGHS
jgi:hypothetical protein